MDDNEPGTSGILPEDYTIPESSVLILWFGILVYFDFQTNLFFTGEMYGSTRALFLSKSIILFGMAIIVSKVLD